MSLQTNCILKPVREAAGAEVAVAVDWQQQQQQATETVAAVGWQQQQQQTTEVAVAEALVELAARAKASSC